MCRCCCHDIVSMPIFSITYFFGVVVVVPVVILLFSLPLLLSAPHNILFFCYTDGWIDGMCMNWRASKNEMAIQVPKEICFSAQRTISCVFVRPHIAKHKNSLRCYNRDKSHLIIIVMCSNGKIRDQMREQKREHFSIEHTDTQLTSICATAQNEQAKICSNIA